MVRASAGRGAVPSPGRHDRARQIARVTRAAGVGARIVQVGDLAGPEVRLPAQALRNRAVTVTGSDGFAPPQVRGQAYGRWSRPLRPAGCG